MLRFMRVWAHNKKNNWSKLLKSGQLTNFTFGIAPRMSCRVIIVGVEVLPAAPDAVEKAEAVAETAFLIAS